MQKKGKRQDCFGGCGRRILTFYNPTGYCRKCQRKYRHIYEKNEARKNREAENGEQQGT
jgi:hypothetical protein